MAFIEYARKVTGQGVQVINWKPTGEYEPTEIIVLDGRPHVTDVPIRTDMVNVGINAWGGEYCSSLTDAAMTGGDVYWDSENEKFTQTATGAVHFGYITPGCGCTAAGGRICVVHCPNGTALAGESSESSESD